MRCFLCRILKALCRETPARRFGFIFVGQGMITMTNNYVQGSSHVATLALADANGVSRPLPAGVVPVWSVTPPAALTLSPAADGMTCAFVAGTTDGDFTLTATTTYPDTDADVVNFAGAVVDPEDTTGTITVV
jgi:hypothetical protein